MDSSTNLGGSSASRYCSPFLIPDIYSFDQAYITWINEVRAWTLHAAGLDKDDAVEIGKRLIPLEPMVSPPQ